MSDGKTIQEPQSPNQPSNLAEAFMALRSNDAAPTPESLEDQHLGEGQLEEDEHANNGGLEQDATTHEEDNSGAEIPPIQSEFDGEAGGSPDIDNGFDPEAGREQVAYDTNEYQSIQRNLAESINRQATMAANQKFREEGIQKMSINQLYQRDENTGRVSFVNPDDPDRPFEDRAAAQRWVDSFNSSIDYEWQQYAKQMQQQFIQDTAPAMRLLQFAPVYDSMSENVKATFDILIEPYSVRDRSGAVIGFNCDLDAMHAQAKKIEDRYGWQSAQAGAGEAQPAQPQAAAGPALDAPTSGSGTGAKDNKEPKNLSEAFKMIKEENKKAREEKKNGK